MGMPHKILLSLMTCVSIATNASALSNSYCVDETPSDHEPPRPRLDYSYRTEISGRWVDLQGMAYMYEYYDHQDNKLTYDSIWQGFEYTEIYDLDRRSLIFSIQERCTLLRDYKGVDKIKEKGLRSLDILLNLGGVWKYHGEKVIRGVEVEQWRSCNGWSFSANFTSDYYFTKEEQNPFRLEMKGIKKESESGQTSEFHRIYDYVMFQRMKPSRVVFQPPPGEVCAGQVEITPPLPLSASYRVEEMNPVEKRVSYSKVFYDKLRGLSKEEDEKKTTFRDFERGYQFEINKETKKCTRKPFYRFGNSINSKSIIHMATLQHFFMDNRTFTYNGVHRARGISCDMYTKKSHAAEELGFSLVEIYIARPEVNTTGDNNNNNTLGDVPLSQRQPVQILMKGGLERHHMHVKRQLEIFDFDPEYLPGYSLFDLTLCFSPEKKIEFSLTYEGNTSNLYDRGIEMKRKLSDKISADLGISRLRVSLLIAIVVRDGRVNIWGTLFDAENETMIFQTVPNMQNIINKTEDLYYVIQNLENTPTICSDFCFDESQRPENYTTYYCWAFEFDRETKDCTFFFMPFRDFNDTNENLAFSDHIDLYKRSPDVHSDHISVSQAWNLFQKRVDQGVVTYTDGNGQVLTATSVTRRDRPEPPRQTPYAPDHPLSQFKTISGLIETNPVEMIPRITRAACARHCINSLTYICEAFQYHTLLLTCSFYNSSSHGYTHSNVSTKSTRVNYVRDFTINFEKIIGRSVLSSDEDFVLADVTDTNACAEMCVTNQQFYCQSFEMCGAACLLGRNHFYNTLSTNVKENISCVHYTRYYVQEYSKTANKTALSSSNAVEIVNIGVEQCATLCSTSPSFDCNVFEYCDVDSICRLTTKYVNNTYGIEYKQNGMCDFYSRKTGHRRFVNAHKSKLPNMSEADGHTLFTMVVTAVGMFFVGLISTVVLGLVVNKLRSPVRVSTTNSKDNPCEINRKDIDTKL